MNEQIEKYIQKNEIMQNELLEALLRKNKRLFVDTIIDCIVIPSMKENLNTKSNIDDCAKNLEIRKIEITREQEHNIFWTNRQKMLLQIKQEQEIDEKRREMDERRGETDEEWIQWKVKTKYENYEQILTENQQMDDEKRTFGMEKIDKEEIDLKQENLKLYTEVLKEQKKIIDDTINAGYAMSEEIWNECAADINVVKRLFPLSSNKRLLELYGKHLEVDDKALDFKNKQPKLYNKILEEQQQSINQIVELHHEQPEFPIYQIYLKKYRYGYTMTAIYSAIFFLINMAFVAKLVMENSATSNEGIFMIVGLIIALGLLAKIVFIPFYDVRFADIGTHNLDGYQNIGFNITSMGREMPMYPVLIYVFSSIFFGVLFYFRGSFSNGQGILYYLLEAIPQIRFDFITEIFSDYVLLFALIIVIALVSILFWRLHQNKKDEKF